ncbi:MAG: hypothetical protein ACOX62_11000 [Christensenellales bacterium]|jgi:hypothetical protein
MKKLFAPVFALILILALYAPAPAEGTAQTGLAAYGDCDDVESLLDTADRALADGMDPKAVGEEMYALAEANGLADAFSWHTENIAASDTDEYRRFQNSFPHFDRMLPDHTDGQVNGVSVYSATEVSDAMKALLADPGAQFCYEPVYWSESDFANFYGVSYAKFKPSRPRAGYVCVVVKDGAESAPKTGWKKDEEGDFDNALTQHVAELLWKLEDDAPILTGNPNLASSFLVFDLQYPFRGFYGSEEPYVKGYNCTVSLTLTNAKSRSAIASITRTNRLGNTIYSWNNWIAKADVPELYEGRDYAGFAEKIRAALIKERAKAVSARKITNLNAGSVLNGILAEQADKTKNAWQAAIYNAGTKNAKLEDGALTFNLRGYDPLLSELGKYASAEDKTAWLMSALTNAAAYRLALSVPVKDGEVTAKGLNALKQAVTKAASAAQKAFGGKELSAALTAYLFPSPIDGKLASASDLLKPTEAFADRMSEMRLAADTPENALSSLFYAQKSQTLNAKGGPDALAMSCVGVDPASLLQLAYTAVLDAQAYLPKEGRFDTHDALLDALKQGIADKAVAAKKKANYKFTVTFSVDDLLAGRLPADYAAYLGAFAYEESAEGLETTVERLPDIAAIPMPKTGRLSGSTSGTQVTFLLSKDSKATYIQMRRADSNALAVSCFVEAGKRITVKVPSGEYTIAWGSGPYWYGEELLFGDLGAYSKSDPTGIKGRNYKHTFTLESSEEGDVGFHDADLSDFH